MQSLDVLATAPAPAQLIVRMLNTMGGLSGGRWISVSLWLVDDATDSLILHADVEREEVDRGQRKMDCHPFVKDPFCWKKDVGLQELFFAGVPIAYEDIETDARISTALQTFFRSGGTRKILRLPMLIGGKVKGFVTIRSAPQQLQQRGTSTGT